MLQPPPDHTEVETYRATNREKAITAKRARFWCLCDRELVSPSEKCPVCHRRGNRKKLRIPAYIP